MYSINKIKAAAATLTLGFVLALAFAATAHAGGGRPQGLTEQQLTAVRARAEAVDRHYHLGAYTPAAVAHRAEKRRAEATDRHYGLGNYAVIKASSTFDWTDASIGAGAMLGAVTLGAGLMAVIRRRPIGKPDFPATN